MNAILFVWTVVAAAGSNYSQDGQPFYDWRPMGEFSSIASCEVAAKKLGLEEKRFKCVRKT